MTAVNLHDLINQPGAGKHIPQLIKSGNWDEYAGMPMKKWMVDVEGVITETKTYTVDARTEEEAEEKITNRADLDFDEYEITGVNECN